jgi:HD-GYP domain-containing protein (c-di-GMP phosphodiesterase class II)
LKGDEIPLEARIFAVVDTWDALSSNRPYRTALPEEDVIQIIREETGTHFDPSVAEVFLKLISRDLV